MLTSVELLKQLPPALRGRFESLGAYVSTVIRDIEDRRRVPKRLRMPAEIKQDIALLVVIAALRQFLQEGTRAATAAAEKALSLGLSGFSIGRTLFTPSNENTRRGAILAEAMWAQIEDKRLKKLLDSPPSLSKLVEELYAIAKHPERLDRYREAP